MYNYIPHPSNARVSNEILELLVEEGASGYGIYWMLLEMLRDAPSYQLPYKPKSLAFGLHLADTSQLERVVNNYNLFSVDVLGNFSCSWLSAQMEEYDEKKKKLQEAGRRGAANRWKTTSCENGEAIATPSQEDSQTEAYNITQCNTTLPNLTLPDLSGSKRVDTGFLELICNTQPAGHASGYVAQVCLQYGMTEATHNFICEHSENAKLGNPTFERFRAIVKRIQGEKWVPKHPDNFFLKKLFE